MSESSTIEVEKVTRIKMTVDGSTFEYDSSDNTVGVWREHTCSTFEVNKDIADQLVFFFARVYEELLNERA